MEDTQEYKDPVCYISGVIANACIWISLWFLVDIGFNYLQVKHQIISYLLLLIVSVVVLYSCACRGVTL